MRGHDADRGNRIVRIGLVATTLLVVVGAVAGYAMIVGQTRLLTDEGAHASQVWLFGGGKFEILTAITMFPTYHAILALIQRATGFHDVASLRLMNLIGGMLLPILVWRLVAMHSPQESGRRTVQWFYMPLLFPLFFLVYTDVWALAAMLATQLCALRGRYVLAGWAGLLATLLRQDMVVWVGMAWLLVFVGDVDFRLWRREWRTQVLPGFARGLPLLLVLLSFLSFYLWNHGIALGDRGKHEVGFNPTNIAYALLYAWFLFLPQNVRAVPRIGILLRRPACIALVVAGFALYMGTYANTHEYNSEQLRFYLHNEGLYWLDQYTWIRAVAYVPMAWMVLTLCVIDLAQPRLRLMYLVAPLSIGLHPLIEQRYYLPALTLFQVWRPAASGRWENAVLVIYAVMAVAILWGTATTRFFL